jgi:hypothetical protein
MLLHTAKMMKAGYVNAFVIPVWCVAGTLKISYLGSRFSIWRLLSPGVTTELSSTVTHPFCA